MSPAVPSPHTTLLVVLGASAWPKFPDFQPSAAFANAAHGVRDYFLDASGFGLPAQHVLDLFDCDASADDIDAEVGAWLQERTGAKGAARDLILYFVGHGGFADHSEDFYLAIRRTRADSPMSSGLRMASLAYTLKEKARYLRRSIILDCCFAASAYTAFQSSGAAEVATVKAREAFAMPGKGAGFPSRGTSLLCSSRHNTPSLLAPDGSATMFSQGLLAALRTGSADAAELLSLRGLGELVGAFLQGTYEGAAPRPEVHSPDQSEGDVAAVPLFPNAAAPAFVPIVIERERYRSLEARLSAVAWSPDLLKRAFTQSLPSAPVPSTTDGTPALLAPMLRALANAMQRHDGRFPILDFVARLATAAPAAGDELRAWVAEAAAGLGVPAPDGAALLAESRKSDAAQPSLMVMLTPLDWRGQDISERTEFVVQAWLWRGADEVETLKPSLDDPERDEHRHALGEMPAVMDDLLNRCFYRLEEVDGLPIELFVPLPLLGWNVEGWEIASGIGEVASLGTHAPVILRSLERIHPLFIRNLWPPWKRKWGQVALNANRPAREAAFFDRPADLTWRDQLNQPEVVFLALTERLAGGAVADDLLRIAINSGTPAALWLSSCDCPDGDEARRQIELLLEECPLAHLPQHVWRRRQAAADAPGQLASGVKLLWDDQGRLPFNPIAQRAVGPRPTRRPS